MSIDVEAVFAAVRAVPAGTVITYGDLAERVGLTRNHARAVGNVLGNRPDNDAWTTTPPEDHDIPWWRVVKADGTLLADEDEDGREWVAWAKSVLVSEGVEFTNDGRVASLAGDRRSRSGGSSARSSAARRVREPEPCWRHDKIQYTCRDCAPGR
jgi:alkylated DNA nucleotide flippase Atl1